MFGLLIREGKNRGPLKNIGDYVQSIAQRQFLRNKETCLVEIEELSDFKSDKQINVIMNGWFTWNCNKFLPPDNINPLFVSFHLTPPQEKAFFTPEVVNYLKLHQPIGARDSKTEEMMKAHGIDSYLSGCLTLTLGKEYLQQGPHDGDVYIVDPYLEFGGDKSRPIIIRLLKSLYYSIRYYRKAKLLIGKYIDQYSTPISKLSIKADHFIQTATFYAVYSQRFSDEILLNAKYLTVLVDNNLSNEKKFELADKMLKNYANAKFVLTSRLHVSFPCLAVHTKNIFVTPSYKNEEKTVLRYTGRLKGLEDTVTIMELQNGKLIDRTDKLPCKMNLENLPSNKNGYIKYCDSLSKKVTRFVESFK